MFRWFVGLGIDDPVWVPTYSPRTGPAADDGHVAKGDGSDLGASRGRAAAVDEHFSVDGTLIKAWASMKSFQPKSEATRLTMKGRAIRPPGYHP